ncbi:hypothetical protein QTL86_16890 [Cellulosilyticum sp. ST5]|uniref:hypothetical protein n=1 Tax=Cellulosilyticum sp. ST5 TaxID=3055805 RepID=UPI003977ADA1
MNQKTQSKKSIIIFLWFFNLTSSLGLGEALCNYFEWQPIMRLLPLSIGILLGVCITAIILKSSQIQRFFPLLILEFIYLGISAYSIAYNKILEASSSILIHKRYIMLMFVMSGVVLGCIILGIMCLIQAYRKFQKKAKTSNSGALNPLYYQIVIPKAIFVGIGLVVIYLLSIPVINHMFFSEVKWKPFYFSMLDIVVGAICATTASIILVASLRKK